MFATSHPKHSCHRHVLCSLAIATAILSPCVEAVDIVKAGNSDDLNLGSSWAAGSAVASPDVALWDATVTGANTVGLGGDLSWGGIKLTSPGGKVTIKQGNSLTLGSSGIDMLLATQNLSLNSAVVLGADQTWNTAAGTTLEANGGVTGGFKITKSGSGTLTLSSTNGYSGGTTLTAGTVAFATGSLGTAGAVTMNGGRLLWSASNAQDLSSRLMLVTGKDAFFDTNGNNVSFATGIGSGTSGRLVKLGEGTLSIQGQNNFTGTTTVQGGTLRLDYAGNNNTKLADAAKLILKGGTLELAGGSHNELVSSTEIYSDSSGFGGKANTVTRSSGDSVLQMNALTRTISNGATIDFAQANIATTDTLNSNNIIGGWATVGKANWAINSTNGQDGAITAYTGYVDDTWTAGNNVTVTKDTEQSSATANSLRFNNAGARTITLVGTNVLTSGGLLVTDGVGTNATNISGGTLTATGGQDLVIHQHNTKGDLIIGSAIANNVSNVALTKSGDGRVVLTTAASHGGGTYVNAGVLRLQSGTQNTNMLTGGGGRIYIASGAALEFENGTSGSGGAHAFQLSGTGISNGGAIRNISGNNTAGGAVALYADSRINSDAGTLTMSGGIQNSAAWNVALYIGGAGNVTLGGNVTSGLTVVKDGTGTLTLSGTGNTYSGGTIISGGTLSISAMSRLSSSGMVELNGGRLQYTGGTASAARNLRLNAAAGNGIEVTTAAATLTNSGVMDGAGGFTKSGAGTLELSGANSYTGKTTVSEGKLKVSGSIGASTTIEVRAGAYLEGGPSGFNLGASQTISGPGTVIGSMTVAGTLSPGSSPGTLTTGSQTWIDGADYNWQVRDATGAAGSGYDTIAITGTLDLANLTTGGFNINLWSLAGISPDVNGDASGFDPSAAYAWTILTASGGISGFDATDFLINVGAANGTAGFSNATDGGLFSLSQSGNDLVLSFTAVPEPSSLVLGGLGLLALGRRRRVSSK